MRISGAVWNKRVGGELVFFSLAICLGLFAVIMTIFNPQTEIPAISVINGNETVFIIDAGHGFPDGGASSASGMLESELNLQIAKRLETMLSFFGGNTLMTRTDENSIYDPSADTIREKKRSDLKNRVNMVNSQPDALLISIHQNYFTNPKYKGAQVFFAADELSAEFGKTVQTNLRAALDSENTRSATKIPSSVYLFKKLEKPGILIECGFLSNDQDTKLLADDDYQKKIAMAVTASILNFEKEV